MKDKNQFLQAIWNTIEQALKKLPHTKEDKEKIQKLLEFYGRKKYMSQGTVKNTAAGIIGLYARINFLGSENKQWQQKPLAKVCGVSASTVSAKAALLMQALKLYPFDQRFARESAAEQNPMSKFAVDPLSGFIFMRDDPIDGVAGIPMLRNKHDYYYDAMEYLQMGNTDGALRLLRKAREIDEHYVEAYVGITDVYQQKENPKKIREYTEKAFQETLRAFGQWPKKLPWGVIENRQFLRAIANKAFMHWEDKEYEDTKKLFRLLLTLNPNDNQGIRYLLAGLHAGLTGDDVGALFDKGNEMQNWDELERLVETQNAIHEFWKPPLEDE